MIGTYTNEDCMDLMSRYPDKHFDLAIVDPPYGIGEAAGKNASRNKGFGRDKNKICLSRDYGNKDWDNSAPSKEYFLELFRVSKNQIIFGANHFIENLPKQNSSCWIVWDKDNGESDFADCELAWASFKTAVRKFKYRWNGLLQENMKNKEKRIHPTQKPVALYEWILSKYAKKGDLILDTHTGSASSLIACENLGFEYIACEKDPDYYQESMMRLENHLSIGKLFDSPLKIQQENKLFD